MDRRVGNSKKMGALFGILAAIGGPIPEPETIPYALFIISRRLHDIVSGEAYLTFSDLEVLVMPLIGACLNTDVMPSHFLSVIVWSVHDADDCMPGCSSHMLKHLDKVAPTHKLVYYA